MEDKTLTIRDMYTYQQNLQAKYSEKWGEPIVPETGKNKLLWAYGEMAEAGDILKKRGTDAAMHDPELRRAFMEEIGDVMMYLYDVLLCLGMSPEEFSEIYKAKCERNKNRW
jgi:NTP pyrophosphatase (non-canonical NTP hydrolase)